MTLSNGKNIPAVLLGNKSDEMEGDVESVVDHMTKFCDEKGFDAFYATSAKVSSRSSVAVAGLDLRSFSLLEELHK